MKITSHAILAVVSFAGITCAGIASASTVTVIVSRVPNTSQGGLPNLTQGQNIPISSGAGAIGIPASPLTSGGCGGACIQTFITHQPVTFTASQNNHINIQDPAVAVQRQINGAFAHQTKLSLPATSSSAAAMANLEPAAGGEVTPEMIANAYLAEKGLLAQ